MKHFLYQRRDISWLSFNHRVLQEAADPSVPLYERIKFLAIYSSNLDEFYRVRVAALRRFKEIDKEERKALMDIRPKKELKTIKKIVHQQQSEFGRIFRQEILPALRENGIFLLQNSEQFSKEQKAFAKQYFQKQVLPFIERKYIRINSKAPFLKNRALYLIVELKKSDRLGLIHIPSEALPRFLHLPSSEGKHFIAFIDDVIRLNLSQVFAEQISNAFAIKVSRDAELYIDDEFDGDLLEKIKASLTTRDAGLPTRMLYDSNMPITLVNQLKSIFQLKKNDLFPGGRYHNFNDFFGFPDPTEQPSLHDQPLPPLAHPILENSTHIIDAIQKEDLLLHFPYQKYEYIPQLIQEAARHPEVLGIKITLYRVASKSAVIEALLEAIKQGKKVLAFIEAKARFDEASNIYWGKELEIAGATVLYSYPGIKVHSKVFHIQFKKNSNYKNIAYLGTGNFNEKTAKLYSDHALLTSKKKIVRDVDQLFGLLEKKILLPKTKKLLLSPFSARTGFEKLIKTEIEQAKAGQAAYMILKMNSLEDQGMIDALYLANNAGVTITLIVRGICCLVPGIAGQSENIQVFSLVDRFLEHARVYIFGNGGKERMYLASADWMTRNLDRRIEAIFPIENQRLYDQIQRIIDLQLMDNTKLRKITADLDNPYLEKGAEEESCNAQTAIYDYLGAALTKGKIDESDS